MRLTLIQAPNGLYDRYDLAPPLSLLSVGAVAEDEGVETTLLDFNLRGIRNPNWFAGDFYTAAARTILETGPDVVGFTSMALESHVCLELARRLKQQDPHVATILGGPHFSAIAREVLHLYSWIDFVVTGEGEGAIRALLRYLHGQATDSDLTNVAHRHADDVSLQRTLKPLPALSELPSPAYHLVDLPSYFDANPRRLLDYEHGRGCIFRCSFCYSPVHWGQGEQVKEVNRIVEEVSRLRQLGAQHLFFVQDNFLNSQSGAKAICEALAEADLGVTWTCYATLPQLTPDMLDAMAAAGCNDVFVGVDAVSASSQRAFSKHFFKGWEPLEQRLRACLDRGIVPTCAFMVDFPTEGHTDTDAVLTTALFARNLGCGIRLNTLTLYNGTASELALRDRRKAYTEIKPRLLFDTSDVTCENPYAWDHPELFPFHNTFLPLDAYHRFAVASHVADTLFFSFPRTLMQHVVMDGSSLWQTVDALAGQVGDITQVHPLLRRTVEQRLFMRSWSGQSLSRATRDALALESAALQLSRPWPEERVDVQTQAGPIRFRVASYTVVMLAHRPEHLGVSAAVEALPEPCRFLINVRESRIRYEEVTPPLSEWLSELEEARRTGSPVRLAPHGIDELIRMAVLERLQTPSNVGESETADHTAVAIADQDDSSDTSARGEAATNSMSVAAGE